MLRFCFILICIRPQHHGFLGGGSGIEFGIFKTWKLEVLKYFKLESWNQFQAWNLKIQVSSLELENSLNLKFWNPESWKLEIIVFTMVFKYSRFKISSFWNLQISSTNFGFQGSRLKPVFKIQAWIPKCH